MKRTTKKLLYTGIIIILVIIAACGFGVYYMLYMPNFTPSGTKYVHICEDDKNFDRLCEELRDSAGCENIRLFEHLARLRKYPENMKSGRYAVEPGMNNNTLLNRLRRGQQSPVHLTFNNVRSTYDLTEKLSAQLMPDKDDFLMYLDNEDYCRSLGFDTVTIKTMFIPNTYEVYWNISTDKLIKRMKREYDTFWTTDRLKKAANIRLSPVQVSILASIVEEETAIPEEYPVIAGLYINRLMKGMPLQADPTIKYAVRDFSLRRILNKHLEVDSPYNTYLQEGLPPGPIRIPSIKGIDAVLNYMHHNYLYMCAKEDFSGRHNFAVTLKEHNRNAERYRAELNRKGIR
ncbi:MAG: endolytic transglycosylase MltG [Tannerella sp.]|nr:endolytic transglycosylase MltG [Tannerella sp.]